MRHKSLCVRERVQGVVEDEDVSLRTVTVTEFENGEDILLDFQTTAAQNRALLSDKAKNRTF